MLDDLKNEKSLDFLSTQAILQATGKSDWWQKIAVELEKWDVKSETLQEHVTIEHNGKKEESTRYDLFSQALSHVLFQHKYPGFIPLADIDQLLQCNVDYLQIFKNG